MCLPIWHVRQSDKVIKYMKRFISFIVKESKHILRDRRTMLILFGMPVVLMLLFGFAITTDVRNVRTVVVASQISQQDRQAVERLAASEYFTVIARVQTPAEAEIIGGCPWWFHPPCALRSKHPSHKK